jgi:hypothetical protein
MFETVSVAVWHLPQIGLSTEEPVLWAPFDGFDHVFSVDSLWSILVHMNQRIKQSPPTEPHLSGRHIYDRMLPCAPQGSFATLPSPPQCQSAFGTMLYTWIRALCAILGCFPSSATRTHRVGFWRGEVSH